MADGHRAGQKEQGRTERTEQEQGRRELLSICGWMHTHTKSKNNQKAPEFLTTNSNTVGFHRFLYNVSHIFRIFFEVKRALNSPPPKQTFCYESQV